MTGTQLSYSEFTAAMHKAAEAEGWWLSERSDGYLEIQRFDEDPKERFKDDHAASAHVSAQALKGSYMHQLALHLDGTPYRKGATREHWTTELARRAGDD